MSNCRLSMSLTCMSRAQRGVGIGDSDFVCLKMVGNDKFSETEWGEKRKKGQTQGTATLRG